MKSSFENLPEKLSCDGAEIHWFEAHGVGRRDFKVKRVRRLVPRYLFHVK
jgi:hypothetical protein